MFCELFDYVPVGAITDLWQIKLLFKTNVACVVCVLVIRRSAFSKRWMALTFMRIFSGKWL